MVEPREKNTQFAVCIRNDDYPASLEKRKIYEILPDTEAEKYHQLRIIDESGEDYLYPKDYFVPIKLPKDVEQAVIEAA
jgi:hypothetical protein